MRSTATLAAVVLVAGWTLASGLEERDGRWINPLAETSPVTVDLQVQHAIGDLRLRAK